MPKLFRGCAFENATRYDWVELTWSDMEGRHPDCSEHKSGEMGDQQQGYKANERLARSIVDARGPSSESREEA
jgi:hypothetical protein